MKRLPQKWAVLLLVIGVSMLGASHANAGWVGPKLAGVWEINGMPDPVDGDACGPTDPFTNLASIALDGTITNVDPAIGTGVGEGYRLGRKKYAVGFFGFIPIGPGITLRYEVQGTAKLLNSGEFEGRFRTTLTDPNGVLPACVYEGSISGTRLVAMPY